MKAYLVDNENRAAFVNEIEAMHRHRHDLFVGSMGWKALHSPDGIDIDQFDTAETKYIILVNDYDELVGSDRLNPTVSPHMLANLFPHFATETIPTGPNVWEWSRHAPGRPQWKESINRRIRLYSTIAVLEFAEAFQVDAYSGILESRVLPAAVRLGWEPRPLGPPISYGEGEGVACLCPVKIDLLARLRRIAGLATPLLQYKNLEGKVSWVADPEQAIWKAKSTLALPKETQNHPIPERNETMNESLINPAPFVPRINVVAGIEEQQRLLREHGVLVVEDAMKPDLLGALIHQMDPWFNQAPQGAGPFFGRKTRRFGGLLTKAPVTQDLVLHPTMLELSEKILFAEDLGPARCNAIQLNVTQAIGIEPGEPEQVVHRDEMLYPFNPGFELLVNIMWCIDDFTQQNGATQFVPGSCSWDLNRWPLPKEVVQAEAKAGSAIIWLGSMVHGGGANYSNKMRRGLIISYSLGWLQPTERHLISVSPDVARRMPERLQRLLGYQIHRPNLGWVEGRDPIEWLRGELGEMAAAGDYLPEEQEAIVEGYYAERSKQMLKLNEPA